MSYCKPENFDYDYRSLSEDEPGIYLLMRKTHLLNGKPTPATTFHIKIGMAYTKACRRAKQQQGWYIGEDLLTNTGIKVGSLESYVAIREIRYNSTVPIQLIKDVEELYHDAMRNIWDFSSGWGYEWFQVDEEFYSKVAEYGFNAFGNIVPSIADHVMSLSY